MGCNGLRRRAFRTEWDGLGCFFLFDVPALFPRFRRSDATMPGGWAKKSAAVLAGASRRTAPGRIFDREQVAALRAQKLSLRQIAKKLGLVTVTRTLQACSKTS